MPLSGAACDAPRETAPVQRAAAATMRAVPNFLRPLACCLICGLLPWEGTASAAARVPASDAEVLATVPARARDPRARELAALRAAWREQPHNVDRAVSLARRYFEQLAVDGDPRYVGYAQAALQPWWSLAQPPAAVRVLRAQVLQFDHRFDAALADLDAALLEQPGNGEAWAWRTAILMVQARYDAARASCAGLAPLATPLVAAACLAQVDAVTGRAAQAAGALQMALQEAPAADAGAVAERLWALTRLAETEERRGQFAAAEKAFREALALKLPDVYLQAAYADFLLDRGRAAEVLALLKDAGRADVLLLRLALAAQATGDARAPRLTQALGERFDAARLRGNTSHRKEESRYALALQGDTARALALAQQNWAEQREPADARILLEAALASRNAGAARPVLDWMAASRIESVALQGLAARLRALP